MEGRLWVWRVGLFGGGDMWILVGVYGYWVVVREVGGGGGLGWGCCGDSEVFCFVLRECYVVWVGVGVVEGCVVGDEGRERVGEEMEVGVE